jgi:hypothetical protein
LAIVAGREASLARGVLEGLGVTLQRAEERFVNSLLGAEPPIRSAVARGPDVQPAPVFYKILGWVTGFSTAQGIAPTDEVTLLALCWLVGNPLARGVSRQAVVDALADQGHPVPVGPVPPDLEIGERINVTPARLTEVIATLQEAGLLVGFNTDPENSNAWVTVHAGDERARQLVHAVVSVRPVT